MSLALLGQALGSVGTGVLSYYGQKEANQTNQNMARETNAYNKEEAAENRRFQAQMSNTAHQRNKNDLLAAGLNPLLAANDASSTPGGSAASGTTARVENEMSGALTSAMEFQQLALAAKKQKAEIGLMNDQAELTKAQKSKANVETKVLTKGIPEAELKNDIYDTVRPVIKKIKEAFTPNAIKYDKGVFKDKPVYINHNK